MTKTPGGERYSVQKPLIGYVREPAAEYVTSDVALRQRGGKTGFVFKELFINQMQKLNPDFMNQELAEEIIKRLERIPPNIEGNLVAWEYLRGLRTVFVPDESRERNVRFIDTENIDRNELETQLYGNLDAVGIEQVEVAESKRHLKELLTNDRRKTGQLPHGCVTRSHLYRIHRHTD